MTTQKPDADLTACAASTQNTSDDSITRFYFDDCDMRGEMVTLKKSVQAATEHQHLPANAQALLAEFLSGAALLAGILKFEGLLTLQIRGDGLVPMIMAEATHERSLRGIVKLAQQEHNDGAIVTNADIEGKPLRELVGNGVLTLTIDPIKGQRYQGIVPLEGDTIADCLSHYFTQSEQLPTKLWLFSDENSAGGLFLQSLPAVSRQAEYRDNSGIEPAERAANDWQTLVTLVNTLTTEESLNLSHETQLTRLFHEFTLRTASNVPAQFACSCSQERSENAIAAIGKLDAYALLKEQATIAIDCQFCGQNYQLGGEDLDRIFASNDQLH
ncbi:Hsp33 family molecular chaperone HslO [Marinagarivorans cellulosilyticus]|uniref:33 kDa chaperonin n=1 Tax=Marinagarivorans cellulosilyticus TaxID=2721545 RepID=A0AAN1WKC5_9GAMM|nr:Hsp33 family molecular chaperone HslO [Marinagarivorans cellulosilyticus]BCD99155.1 molecular chaperone Hsp33 [Marinagarivorans cellulosilyticus]